jgi:hypothetical protein
MAGMPSSGSQLRHLIALQNQRVAPARHIGPLSMATIALVVNSTQAMSYANTTGNKKAA